MSLVISRPDLFPASTSVSAYATRGTGRTPTSGAPAGSAAETASVQANGTVTFSDLVNGQVYILYASSPDRYLRVMQTALGGSRGSRVWSSGGVPSRASGVTFTDWVGPDDPAANAIDGDTWTDTSA
jgi:hypothetical protein